MIQERSTKEQILDTAVELFTSQGYERTSLREIADRVGITKASLYYHFPSKDALLRAIVAPFADDVRETVEEAEALPNGPQTVRHVLARVLDTMLRHRAAGRLFTRDFTAVLRVLEPMLPDLMEHIMRLHAWLAGPEPTPGARIRAVVATEALGVGLSSAALIPEVTEDELRRNLLQAAAAVLAVAEPPDPS